MVVRNLFVWVRNCCLIILFLFGISACSLSGYARELPADVQIVADEKEMMEQLLKGMRQHKTYFAFYYEGIEKDFRKYGKHSSDYQGFWDKLALRDGYLMGVTSGGCISICGGEQKYVIIQFGYLTTKRQEKRIDKHMKKLVKKIGKGSRVNQIMQAHNYLLEHMRYDSGYYSPYDALLKGKGMCMAYALAFQRIMQEMGIPCLYIKGKDHAWNMVKVGKYWYNVDVTWDDGGRDRYRYFLKSDKDFPGHKRPALNLYKSLRIAKKSYLLKKKK